MDRRTFLKMSALFTAGNSLPLSIAAAPSSEKKSIFSAAPHVQLLNNNSLGIVWMTDKNSTGFVTWTQDSWQTSNKAWLEEDGLLNANCKIHKAILSNVDFSKKVDFKIHSRPFLKFEAYKVSYSGPESTLSASINPILPEKNVVTWAMLNDVHDIKNVYNKFIPQMKDVSAFCLLNGDILSHITNEKHIINSLLNPAAQIAKAAHLPIWYLRGNHETRGPYARNLRDYLCLQNNNYYGAITLNGARFVFIDTGEDKPDTNREYSGLVSFDSYMYKQLEWLKREFSSNAWKKARARIVFQHIPTAHEYVHGVNSNSIWSPGLKRLDKLAELLKTANITLMAGAHMHYWGWHKPKSYRPYHLVVGGGTNQGKPNRGSSTLTKFRLDDTSLKVTCIHNSGKVFFNKEIKL